MAVIKLSNTKVASRLIAYCEKRAEERDGINCDPTHAKEQFKATRELFGKPDGVQAHHIIQSFSPEDNISPQQANEIGKLLAERVAPNHEVAVFTHTDKDHIHNHIVVNAVSFENGQKYHSNREQLFKIRETSNELCKERGFEVIKEPQAKERFAMAEYKLVERGEPLWKDQLRSAIDKAKEQTSSLQEMQSYLKETYGIEMKIQNKNVSFLHPEKQRYCRGDRLGASYSKGEIEREYETQTDSRTRADQPTGERTGFRNQEYGNGIERASNSDHFRPSGNRENDHRSQQEQDSVNRTAQQGSRSVEERESRPSELHENQTESATGRTTENRRGSEINNSRGQESQERDVQGVRPTESFSEAPDIQASDNLPGERIGGDNSIPTPQAPVSPLNALIEFTKAIQKGLKEMTREDENKRHKPQQKVRRHRQREDDRER